MKFFNMLIKLQKEVFDLPDDELREVNTEVKAYHEKLDDNPTSSLDKLYIKLHKGPWFRVFSVFIYMFILKEFNKIMNPQDQEDEEDRRRNYIR